MWVFFFPFSPLPRSSMMAPSAAELMESTMAADSLSLFFFLPLFVGGIRGVLLAMTGRDGGAKPFYAPLNLTDAAKQGWAIFFLSFFSLPSPFWAGKSANPRRRYYSESLRWHA